MHTVTIGLAGSYAPEPQNGSLFAVLLVRLGNGKRLELLGMKPITGMSAKFCGVAAGRLSISEMSITHAPASGEF